MPTWTPIAAADLPIIICGPILRKVTKTEVSVWLVLKEKVDVTLKIYSPNSEGGSVILQSSTVSPRKLGNHVYVTCVKATDVVHTLSEEITYGYDIELGPPSPLENLSSPGVLKVGGSGIDTITYPTTPMYPPGKLPSFILPKTDLADVRLLHGSCRKPHAEGVDAFAGMNEIIEGTINSEEHIRPQMLLLTGDQIYGDDVSDSLLYMIIMNCAELFGWEEPLATEGVYNEYPGHRFGAITFFDAEPELAKSHLFKFQEYFMMYMMVWSPNLWPTKMEGIERVMVKPTFEDTQTPIYPLPPGDFNKVRIIPQYNEFQGVKTIEIPPEVLIEPEYFGQEVYRLTKFHSTLSDVQKLMANIPSYMMLDDHDVTDDLFITEKWSEDFLGDSFSRRIIQNGLTAYSLCQAWGNSPDEFLSGRPGEILLNKLESLTISPEDLTLWASIGNIVLPQIVTSGSGKELIHSPEGIDFHWRYNGTNFEVLALDGRTRRAFRYGSEQEMGSLSDSAILDQIANVSDDRKDLTILLTAAPLFGVNIIEQRLGSAYRDTFESIYDLDRESWNLDEGTLHRTLEALATRCKDHLSLGSNDDLRKHRFLVLSGDVHYGFSNNIVFKASVTPTVGYNIELLMSQCCSSSLRNQKHGDYATTVFQHSIILESGKFFHGISDVGGFSPRNPVKDNVGVYSDKFRLNRYNGGVFQDQIALAYAANVELKTSGGRFIDPPFAFSVAAYYKLEVVIDDYYWGVIPEGWEYKVAFDWRLTVKPVKSILLVDIIASIPSYPTFEIYKLNSAQPGKLGAADNFVGAEVKETAANGRYIVGLNNFGDISLNWTAELKQVEHRIWWRNQSPLPAVILSCFPLTIHQIDIT